MSSLWFSVKLILLLMAAMSLAQPLHDSPPPFPSPSPQPQSYKEGELLKTPPCDSDQTKNPQTFPSNNQPQPHSDIQLKPLIFGSSKTKASDSEKPQPPQIISEPHQPQNNFMALKPMLLLDEVEMIKSCGANAFYKEESCFCNKGYQGNPYVGCVDIDECSEVGCATPAKCTNFPGWYCCRCPFPYDGDGKLDGSGCKFGYCQIVSFVIRRLILYVALYFWFRR